MSTTGRRAWLKLLRYIGVKHFHAISGLGLPFVCHLSDQSGEGPFYEPFLSIPEVILMASWCEAIENPVILDIGANNGFIATQLAQRLYEKGPRIYAFEPIPRTFAQLKLYIESFKLNDFVVPICCALSDSTGIATMSYSLRQSLFAQMRDGTPNPRVGNLSTLVVTLTIDQIVGSLGIKPSLMKIDVEGFEPRVLRGAAHLLTSSDPPAICLEWNPLTVSEVNSSQSEIIWSLSNYHLYYVDDFEGQRRPFLDEISNVNEISWVCNLFAVPDNVGMKRKWRVSRDAAARLFHSLIQPTDNS
jgi:FkbM family methyltransferase